jgi:hypothetical protein
MNLPDERELVRLANLLAALHDRPDVGADYREALKTPLLR